MEVSASAGLRQVCGVVCAGQRRNLRRGWRQRGWYLALLRPCDQTRVSVARHRPRRWCLPVFGIIKRVMGWSQMSMCGIDNARGERSLVTMAWNIKRLHVLRAA